MKMGRVLTGRRGWEHEEEEDGRQQPECCSPHPRDFGGNFTYPQMQLHHHPSIFPPQVHERALHTGIFKAGPLNAIKWLPWGGALGWGGAAADGTVRLFDVDTVRGGLWSLLGLVYFGFELAWVVRCL
jgi:hypothetical protein